MDGFRWPSGYRSGAALTFDVDGEAGWIGADPENANRPGILSQGRYGTDTGIPLLLPLLNDYGVKATFFVPGIVADGHSDMMATLVQNGHEVALHGYTHRAPASLTEEEEEEEVREAARACRSSYPGVSGYRSPSWDISHRTLDLLEGNGIAYTSQFMDRLVPYRHGGRRLIELPVQWLLDDWPHFAWPRPSSGGGIRSCSEVRDMWMEEFEGIRTLGGVYVLTMHPQLIGRPSRLAMLRQVIEQVLAAEDVWLTTCGAISAHADSVT